MEEEAPRQCAMGRGGGCASGALRLEGLAVGELQDVALTVAAGEVLCLSGVSGSGKSRLLRAVADLDPHEGEAWLGATARASLAGHEWRRRVRLVPAESRWWAERVGDHFPSAEVAGLAALGFESATLDWPVERLSSGERQRLALLRAVTPAPAALLLDEPTANLDAETARRVEDWLCARIREAGWPTIWVAHDIAQIARVADRHLRLEAGRLTEAGDPAWA
ncbi:ABC transporter ATP-binding protein [Halomonas getboli]|uniref:ABC transporter ATP-binding protein n=1 Tax=Halomonas getboli TaxID=2935862 RepID=UPI002000549E|nr:ATP-binding cassette domain-containing protein [Halomonas getboli]MCK2183563.1 ATP-binding cassette domain-containing protein [Halomonas getboli]